MNLDCVGGKVHTWQIGEFNPSFFIIGISYLALLYLLKPHLRKKSPVPVYFAFYTAYVLQYIFIYFYSHKMVFDMVKSGGVYDYGFFLLCFPAIFFYIALSMKRRYRTFAIAVLVCILIIALEEIHWGQAIFFYKPPRWVLSFIYFISWPTREHFYDPTRWCGYKINIHNGFVYILIFLVALVYFGALPLLAGKPNIRRFLDDHGVIVPRSVMSVGLIINVLFADVFLSVKHQHFEHVELLCLTTLLFIAWEGLADRAEIRKGNLPTET